MSSSSRDVFFANAKAYLSKTSNNGDNVFDHVGAVLLKIAEEKPNDAFSAFERFSFYAKQDALEKRKNPEARQLEHSDQGNWNNADLTIRDLFRSNEEIIEDLKKALPPVAEDEEQEEPELPEPNDGHLPDLVGEQRLLEWAGAGFSSEETYALMLSMKGLVESAPLEFVRLWGKVLGVHADYYVVESRFKDGEAPDSDAEGAEEEDDGQQGAGEDEDDVAPEEDEENQEETGLGKIKKKIGWGEVPKEKGEGVNKFTYWVTTQLGGAWTRLPNVTPRQIMAARKIRRFLTGDLSHDVASYPPFPGTEAALLRAQIARITHATAISPRGYFVADEAADEGAYAVVKNDEYEPPSMEELVDPETWVHHEPKILLQGRARHFAPEMPEDEGEEDEEGKKKDEREPLPAEFLPEEAPEPLAPITGDAELVPEVIPAWSARNCSVHQPQYGAAALHSNVWPGAVVVAKGKEFASLYVGYGLKYNPEPFTPEPLPAVQADPPEDEEAPEPDFREEYERWLKTQRKQDNDNEDGEQEEDEEED